MKYEERLKLIGIKLLEQFHGAKIHHKMQCVSCSHIWIATPISKIQTNKKYGVNGCPACNNQRKKSRFNKKKKEIQKRIQKAGFTILGEYITYKNLLLVRNNTCEHEWETTPEHILGAGVNCQICNTIRKKKNFQKWNKIRQDQFYKIAPEWKLYKQKVTFLSEQTYKKFKQIINPKNYPRGRAGINEAYHLDHICSRKWCFDKNIPSEICAHPQNLQMLPWKVNAKYHSKFKVDRPIPPIFWKHINNDQVYSSFVHEITSIYNKCDIFSNVLDPYPLTIFLPEYNLGLLFCPFVEYVEQNTKTTRLNLNILRMAEEKNIKLIQIYEDEWFYHKALICSKIKYITNLLNPPLIHARQCSIEKVNSASEKSLFLQSYHIQGTNDGSQIAFGAFHRNCLVAIMTFSLPRIALGGKHKSNNMYELSRFATNTNYRIPGIASRLLKRFEINYPYSQIYSFADRRWSTGDLYYKLGFELTNINQPCYFYVVDGKRKHRWNFRKNTLHRFSSYDPNLTEYQNMLKRGIDRVWDCGTLKFVK